MSSVARNNANPVPRPRSRRRKIAHIGLVALGGMVIFFALLWIQRLSVAGWMLRNSLAEQGIDADLSVSNISPSGAIIDNIHLSVDGRTFFSASQIRTEFYWREALRSELKRIEVDRPHVRVAVDETGRLITPNLSSESSESGNGFPFPQYGVHFNDGQINVNSPFGDVEVKATGTVRNPAQYELSGAFVSNGIAYNTLSGDISGRFDISHASDTTKIIASAQAPRWQIGTVSGRETGLKIDGHLLSREDGLTLSGPVEMEFGALSSTEFETQAGTVSWDGTINVPRETSSKSQSPIISATWQADIKGAALRNPDRRKSLAQTLTLNTALSGISSTAPFAPHLSAQIKPFFSGAQVQGKGHLIYNDRGINLSLNQALNVTTPSRHLEITPVNKAEFYVFDATTGKLTLNFSGTMDGPYASKLTAAKISANSTSGFDIVDITQFTGGLHTQTTWKAFTKSGRATRLAPLVAHIAYTKAQNDRLLSLSGALDYDGDIPGGYVQGLRTQGTMRLNLGGETLKAWFTPRPRSRINISSLDTVSDWIAKNIDISLVPDGPVYTRDTKSGKIVTRIKGGEGTLVHKIRNMDLTFDFSEADISGTMTRRNGDTVKQVWNVNARDAHMISDTIPTIGTDIRAPDLAMTATLEPDQPLYFTAQSPSVDLKTPQMEAKGLSLSAAGTSENLRADYENGRIAFMAMPLPPMPMQGFAQYANGAWSGNALTYLERAKDTQIDVAYRFENGLGTAKVNVEGLPFTPRGLQPKHILPQFGGKVAQVKGFVSAEIDVGFGGNQPLTTRAKTILKNMSMGTLPGPISGLNAELDFSSLYPPATNGPQHLTLAAFDPGLPLENGEVSFELIPDGIKINSARWPMGDGFIALDPTEWRYTASANRMTLRVEGVSLGEFLKDVGGDNFKATGNVTGVLPVVISGVSVLVENGVLTVKDGGVIQFSSPQTDAAGASNEISGHAFDALRNFEYKSLEAKLNGPLDGDLELRMVFTGRNREVLGGAEFLFNVGIEGQLFNIARSFQSGQGISASVMDEITGRDTK